MSIFGTILSKLGFGESKAKETVNTAAVAPVETAPHAMAEIASTENYKTPQTSPTIATPISTLDVVTKLDDLADNSDISLNWKSSIVDLLKLLGLDSSLASRKELAEELGCPSEKMEDSASMNMWLHKNVLKKLAENGGNIPAALIG